MVKNLPANEGNVRDVGPILELGGSLEEAWQLTPVSLPGESHGQKSLLGYSPSGCKESESDTMEAT